MIVKIPAQADIINTPIISASEETMFFLDSKTIKYINAPVPRPEKNLFFNCNGMSSSQNFYGRIGLFNSFSTKFV